MLWKSTAYWKMHPAGCGQRTASDADIADCKKGFYANEPVTLPVTLPVTFKNPLMKVTAAVTLKVTERAKVTGKVTAEKPAVTGFLGVVLLCYFHFLLNLKLEKIESLPIVIRSKTPDARNCTRVKVSK